jgi:phospholipid/cholesterol/gamma-HCH transport system substrate-binding protein
MTSTTTDSGATRRNIRTGLLFLAGVVLVCTLGLVISKNTGFGKGHRGARIFLVDTKGLSVGNPVTISGKKVGAVAALEFGARGDTAGIVVDLDIEGEWFGLIRGDAKATVKGLGMLGDKFVDITVGRARERLGEEAYIAVAHEPGLDQITTNALETTAMLNELLSESVTMARRVNNGEGAIGSLLSSTELTDELTATVSNMRTVTASMASRDGLVHELFTNRETALRLHETIGSMHQMSQLLRTAMSDGNGTLGRLLTDDELYENLLTVSRRADTLVATLGDKSRVLDGFNEQSRIYATMQRTVASLDSLFIDLKRRPSRYVHFSVFD